MARRDPIEACLCSLTSNISTLTILDGYLHLNDLQDDEESRALDLKTIWPRLRKVHFEDFPADDEDAKDLVGRLTERGRRSGAFTVALACDATESRTFQMHSETLQKGFLVKKVDRLSLDKIWPPREN